MATRVQHNRKQQNIVILNINSDHRVITFSKGGILEMDQMELLQGK